MVKVNDLKEFFFLCGNESEANWSDAKSATEALVRAARALDRLNERECSDPTLTSEESEGLTKRHETRARQAVATLGAGKPWPIEFNGDPRGAAIRIKFPSGRSNYWGDNNWWCVPTR